MSSDPHASPVIIEVRLIDGPVDYAVAPIPPSCGAECVFLGRTRREVHPTHGALERLEYEAFKPMAEKEMLALADHAVRTFGCTVVRILHALGPVPPGDASVFVQTVCGHRAESFESCRWLIDTLKARVPIWKRESWADGSTWSEGQPVEVDA